MLRTIFGALLALLALSGSAFAQGAVKGGTPVATPVAAGSLIVTALKLKTLQNVQATAGAAAVWIMVFDSATVPADGTVTPKYCFALGIGGSLPPTSFDAAPEFQSGIVLVMSTTGCFTKTIATSTNMGFMSASFR